MKLIDAHTGKEFSTGSTTGEGTVILGVRPGVLNAEIDFDNPRLGPGTIKLPIRYTHPAFFLQRIVFWPS